MRSVWPNHVLHIPLFYSSHFPLNPLPLYTLAWWYNKGVQQKTLFLKLPVSHKSAVSANMNFTNQYKSEYLYELQHNMSAYSIVLNTQKYKILSETAPNSALKVGRRSLVIRYPLYWKQVNILNTPDDHLPCA